MLSCDLSIIIVSYNSFNFLRDCLLSIRRYPPPVPFEIIVIDNCSEDDTIQKVGNHFQEVSLYGTSENLGFSAANNIGIKQSHGSMLFLMNADTELTEETLPTLLSYMELNPHVGITGPTEFSPKGYPYPSISKFPDVPYLLWTHTTLRHRFCEYKFFHPYRHLWLKAQKNQRPVQVDCVSGASMMIRRKVFHEIGFFDHLYFFYMEETDLCKRAWDSGWEVHFLPAAKIVHHGGGSTKHINPGVPPLSAALGELRYFRKYKSSFQLLLLRNLLILEFTLKLFAIRSSDPRRWAFKEIVQAALGLRSRNIMREEKQ